MRRDLSRHGAGGAGARCCGCRRPRPLAVLSVLIVVAVVGAAVSNMLAGPEPVTARNQLRRRHAAAKPSLVMPPPSQVDLTWVPVDQQLEARGAFGALLGRGRAVPSARCAAERPRRLDGMRTFYVHPVALGSAMLNQKILVERGWTEVDVPCDADVVLYASEGPLWRLLKPWQTVDHLLGEAQLGNKGNLAQLLARGERAGRIDSSSFWPATYHQTDAADQAILREIFNGSAPNVVPWVVKAPGVHLGAGVVLLASEEEYDAVRRTGRASAANQHVCVFGCGDSIVQRYVANPLLLPPHSRKFDLRVYWLVASVEPLRVYYHDGTTRSSLRTYDPEDVRHKQMFLTNVAQQKKSKDDYAEHKEELRLTFDALGEVLKETHPHVPDALTLVRRRMCHAIAAVVVEGRDELTARTRAGTGPDAFSLLGADFLLDTDLNAWLLELQNGPVRSMNTPATAALWNAMSNEQWDMLFEIEGYRERGEAVPRDLRTARTWVLIVDDDGEVQPVG